MKTEGSLGNGEGKDWKDASWCPMTMFLNPGIRFLTKLRGNTVTFPAVACYCLLLRVWFFWKLTEAKPVEKKKSKIQPMIHAFCTWQLWIAKAGNLFPAKQKWQRRKDSSPCSVSLSAFWTGGLSAVLGRNKHSKSKCSLIMLQLRTLFDLTIAFSTWMLTFRINSEIFRDD